MANTRTITDQLKREGLPLELVRESSGYHYFIFDTLDECKSNKTYETKSIMCPRFKDLTAQHWLNLGREFANEMRNLGF